jgi:hypothetical protein
MTEKKILGVPLVPDVHNWRRWWSMRWIIAAAIAEALLIAWPRLPADWVAPTPEWLKAAMGGFSLVALVAAAVSRVVQQKAPPA